MNRSKQGKRNKINGANWESRVREDLETRKFIVCKWHNQVDLELNKLVPAKHKFNFFTKVMSLGSGFPDFIAYRQESINYRVIGVECKCSGGLDKIERKKAGWLLQNKVFSEILVATKDKVGRRIYPRYNKFEVKL